MKLETGDMFITANAQQCKQGIIIILSDVEFAISWSAGSVWNNYSLNDNEMKNILNYEYWRKVE